MSVAHGRSFFNISSKISTFKSYSTQPVNMGKVGSESKKKSKTKTAKVKDEQSTSTVTGEFVFFYGKESVFSQFHPAKFKVDGISYNCMEQYMHHQKAVVFKDEAIAKQIMATGDPLTQKRLGRKVSNFDPKVWGVKSIEVVTEGNVEKFKQNPDMLKQMLNTYPKTLVEASPRDRLWGIGLSANNPKAKDKSKWRGKNLLGKCLTDVREILMKDKKKSEEKLGFTGTVEDQDSNEKSEDW